jgi:hypothetical protein
MKRNLKSFRGRQGVVRGVDVDAGKNFFFKIFYYVNQGGVCSFSVKIDTTLTGEQRGTHQKLLNEIVYAFNSIVTIIIVTSRE